MSDPECVFCRILARSAPASFVSRGDRAAAFMDINPLTPGHLLVVTVEHYPDLASVPPATAAAVMQTAQDCAEALRSSPLAPDGINLLYADGAAAGQEVFHSHLHVVPRFTGDGFGIRAARPPTPSRTDLDALAAEIGAHLR